jgi:hypothetical protein
LHGPVGSSVTITGANFSTTPSADIVYFGSVRAPVTAATANTLTVTVPTGTTNDPVTVTTNGQTAYANAPFTISFAGGGTGFTASSFDGKLDIPVKKQPNDILLVDLDGDGKPDLVSGGVGTDDSIVYLFRNTSANGFLSFAPTQSILARSIPEYMAAGDLDGDGKPDLVIGDASFENGHLSIFRNTSTAGSISFGARTDYSAYSISRIQLSDIDGDGKPDIIATTGAGYSNIAIFQNTSSQGAISFGPPIYLNSPQSGLVMVIKDLDQDGKPDLAILNGPYLSFFRNTSTPGFVVLTDVLDMPVAGSQLFGIAAGDLNADGKIDLVITDAGSNADSVYLYPNTGRPGTISFGPRTALAATYDKGAWAATINDMDGDGSPDLVVTNFYGSSISIFRNTTSSGNFSFDPHVDYPISEYPWAAKTGDLDGDGRPDMVINDQGQNSLAIFRNRIGLPTAAPSILAIGGPAICQGDSVQLISSVVSGDQWYKDGVALPGATGDTLTVQTSGTYTVTTDITGTLSPVSTGVSITVNPIPAKPVITPDSAKGLLSSANSGNQWYQDTLSAIPGAINNSYLPADSGYYSLRVSQNGCTSVFATPYYYHLPKPKDTTATTTSPVIVSPNPNFTGVITIQYDLPGVTSVDIRITDLNGNVLLARNNIHSGDQVDVSMLGKGMYQLTLLSPSGQVYATTSFIRL